jgi:hypothetical protein
MPTPSWLRAYWNERLAPALQEWEVEGGPPTQLQALFEQMLQEWPQIRGKSLSDYTVATYLTQTREWLSGLPLTETNSSVQVETGERHHLALTYFNFPTERWAELTMRSRGTVEQRNQHLVSLPNPASIIARGRELLVHEDWAALAAGILAMAGRRVGEVLVSGQITAKSAYSVLFSGRLKLRGKPDYAFEIPTLCEAPLVLSAWERLRSHPDLLAMHLPVSEPTRPHLDAVNGKLYPKVRQAVTYFFDELLPEVGDEASSEKFSHLLRSLYATLAVWRYCPQRVDPDTFRATILGHRYYFRAQGEERLNYLSGHFYHRFVLLASDGTLDGRRGIALGEPGVSVLDAFAQEERMDQREELPAGTPRVRGRKAKKRKERNSKTGFTLVKPRNESGKAFDRIAQENGLAWKGDDATFQLLLETYQAHQQCQQQRSAVLIGAQLTPEHLGLPAPLAAKVGEAMQQSGQDSFWDFLQHALERESNTQIGLAKTRKERELQRPDFSQVPTSDLLKTRRLPEAYERIRRAIATLIEHNRHTDDPNQRWYITQTLLREFTGAHPRFIKPVLDANAALIQRHHQHFGILPAHNRTPAPKPQSIAKTLTIAEHPADLPVLDEIALPSFDEASSTADDAGRENPASED